MEFGCRIGNNVFIEAAMNFDPNIPITTAVLMGLVAAAMWGTWFISLKYLDDYPVEAFYLTLFSTSMVLVWGAGFLLDGSALITNIRLVWQADPSRVYVTLVCGFVYVAGIFLSLHVIRLIGLALSQPLQASMNLIIGTVLSGLLGGIPQGLTAARMALALVLLLAAILLSMRAGSLRGQAEAVRSSAVEQRNTQQTTRTAILLLAAASLLAPAYSIGLSYGLTSITQPHGMAVMPFMAVLCTGAFLCALVICGTNLTLRKQWSMVWKAGFRVHKFGILSGLAHYGGNIIHTFATRNLSAVVAWPLGITAGLWTQMWGLAYGEFRGSPRRTYIYLFAGMACYILGALVISNLF